MIRTPWGMGSVKGGVPENHAFLPKMPILFRLVVKKQTFNLR